MTPSQGGYGVHCPGLALQPGRATGQTRRACYLSAEFLVGRAVYTICSAWASLRTSTPS